MTEISPSLQEALANRYALIGVIGQGGMATVYRATDLKHHREVAVKVLRPEIAATVGSERFLKEIEIAAQLNHPHILTLIDSGTVDDRCFFVMPYVRGESLRDRLERERRLSPESALALCDEVGGALAYAHRQGVLHRDIKPENILLTEGHAIVADFGIAKAVTTAGGEQLTRTGFPIGTPGYMSPEQAAGLMELDARSDVFSLACVCYEMLVGEIAGRWPTEDAVEAGRFLAAPASHRAVLDTLAPPIEAALVRSMALRAEARPASPTDFLAALRSSAAVPAPARRRYRDTEVDQILGEAAELDRTAPTHPGLTIGGVQDAAAQAGIPARHVRHAAEALHTPAGAEVPNRIVGSPTTVHIRRVIEGEVPESEFAALAEEVSVSLGIEGHVNVLGRTMTWRARAPKDNQSRSIDAMVDQALRESFGDVPDTKVRITRRGGRTYLDIERPTSDLAWAWFGGLLGGVGGVSFAAAFVLAEMGALPTMIGLSGFGVALMGSFAMARQFYRMGFGMRRRELERLADRLEEHMRDVVVPGE